MGAVFLFYLTPPQYKNRDLLYFPVVPKSCALEGGRDRWVAGPCFNPVSGSVMPQNDAAAFPGGTAVTRWHPQLREDTSTGLTQSPFSGLEPGVKVKASDPGRKCQWGKLGGKTNLSLAQGPRTVTSPGWEIRQTRKRRKGRGRVGPREPGLRQPATEEREASGPGGLNPLVRSSQGPARGWSG